MSLVLSILAVTATCVPVDTPKLTKIETVTAFFTALNAGDQPGMGALIKPGTQFVLAAGDTLDLAQLLGMLPAGARLDASDIKLDTDGNVTANTVTSDGVKGVALVKVEGGCITELVSKT